MIDYHGLLGYTFLCNFCVFVNYYSKKIEFKRHSGKFSSKASDNFLPLEITNRLPWIYAYINWKGPLKMLIDTGSAEVLIKPEIFQFLNIDETFQIKGKSDAVSADGIRYGNFVELKEVKIGNFAVSILYVLLLMHQITAFHIFIMVY